MNESTGPDDFDDRARAAGAALRRNAPEDLMDALHRARRRRQATRAVVAGGGAVALVAAVVVGTAALRGDDSTNPVSPPVSTESTEPDAGPTTSAGVSKDLLALGYAFDSSRLDGVTPVGEPAFLGVGLGGTRTIWTSEGGLAESYLYMTTFDGVQDADAEATPSGDVTSVPLEVENGTAWLVKDDVDGDADANVRIEWWREDGQGWEISHSGLSMTRFQELALSIVPGSGLPFVLPDSSMTVLSVSTSVNLEYVSQEWTLDGSPLAMRTTEGGAAQAFIQSPGRLIEVTVAGVTGYRSDLPNGQVDVSWTADERNDRWTTLTIGPELAERADEIIAAVVPSG